jgi:hypothetical protein
MGVPIPRYRDEPLKRRKGYFGLRSTSAIVGETAATVFTEQPSCHTVFYPVLQFPGAVVCDSWDNITLHFVYGPINTGGLFFKVKSLQQLVFLGTKEHGRLPEIDAPLPIDAPHPPEEISAQPISPGFVEFQEWLPGDTESDDEALEGFREAPAVYLGGHPGAMLSDMFPKCIHCDQAMKYVGQLETDGFSDDLYSVGLVLLYCESCQIQCCLDIE